MNSLRLNVKKALLSASFACALSTAAHADATLSVEYCPAPTAINVHWDMTSSRTYKLHIAAPIGWHQVSTQWSTPGAMLMFNGAYAFATDPGTSSWPYLTSKSITCTYKSNMSSDDIISIAKDNPTSTTYTLVNGNTADLVNYWYYYNPASRLAKCSPVVANAYYSCGFAFYK